MTARQAIPRERIDAMASMMADGASKPEICAALELSRHQYDACRRRVLADIADKRCGECNEVLGLENISGYCWRHAYRAIKWDDAGRAKHKAGIKQKLARDPIYAAALKARALAFAQDAEMNARRTAHLKGGAYARPGMAAMQSPEARAKAARSISAARMAWCPPELRDQARALVRRKGIKHAEAKVMILEQHERDMARFTQRLLDASR